MRALKLQLGANSQRQTITAQAVPDTCTCRLGLALQHTALPAGYSLRSKVCRTLNVQRLGLFMGAGESRQYAKSVVVLPRASSMHTRTDIPPLISDTAAWKALAEHVEDIKKTHLKDLLADQARSDLLIREVDGIYADFSRQRVTPKTLQLLLDLAQTADLKGKIDAMFSGQHINSTENRAVMHVATRARRDQVMMVDGKDVVPDVWKVLDKIRSFSNKLRTGEWRGATGKPLKNVVAIGIGGSFLGPLFVHTALKSEERAFHASEGRELRFLANVDPVDVYKSLEGLNPEETLIIVISKTFTTSETMLNARTARAWLTASLGEDAVAQHVVAVSTNLELVAKFGINPENAFGFWDWVGGRYSVCSAVGILPLAVQYGFDIAHDFLKGANAIDDHFHTAPLEQNLPVMLGLFSLWNVSFLGLPARAILPYCEALAKFAPHIQQVSMESNGKGVDIHGRPLPFDAGEVDFGEPGTNGQHSFYQLIHQGRTIPCDFIGFIKSQEPVYLAGEQVPNHDELISNFFAQPDALAYGKTEEVLRTEGTPEELIPHKTFHGNRPSLSLLLPHLDAYTLGQLLALYEHRVAVQGFIWGVNSFDQWGVELGKVLASKVRKTLSMARDAQSHVGSEGGYNYSTTRMLNKYLGEPVEPKPSKTVLPSDLLK